jgi:hypothetical protein
VNALANDDVANYINDNFVATYMKVGTFQIVNGEKQGGNVATYFCLPDGAVIHAVPGKVDAQTLLSESRWANETRKFALTRSTDLAEGEMDQVKFRFLIRQAHEERFAVARSQGRAKVSARLPDSLPTNLSLQAQAHWYLAMDPLAKIDAVFPFVWERILNERLSGLPVVRR